ncbi:hypothetical protein F5Y10DRAFT_235697 [Nemania abortiva]|nr:hypothetical protein F5Y10DRAFT_235697 [Nemania abortiva]
MGSSGEAEAKETPTFKNTEELLRYLYADLTRLSQVASPDIILHPFDDPSAPLHGIAAAQAHEEALIAASGGTLVMDVETIEADSQFGVVLGMMRGRTLDLEDIAVSFLGLWRFVDGKPVEHWEHTAEHNEEAINRFKAAREAFWNCQLEA